MYSFKVLCPLMLSVSLQKCHIRKARHSLLKPSLRFSELISKVNWVVDSRQLCHKTTSGRAVNAEEE